MTKSAFSFSNRLQRLREDRRFTKTALAKKVGVTTTCVWNWEEGNTEPRPENMRALGEALNVPVEYLESGAGWEGAPSAGLPAEGGDDDLSLPSVIAEAKIRIATLAGISSEKVTISLDY